jgi:dihydrofolate reductase
MLEDRWKPRKGRMEYVATDGAHARISLSKGTYRALRDYCDDNEIVGSRMLIRDALRQRLIDEGYLDEVSE